MNEEEYLKLIGVFTRKVDPNRHSWWIIIKSFFVRNVPLTNPEWETYKKIRFWIDFESLKGKPRSQYRWWERL